MKVIFMGTPAFAVPAFEALCARHDVAAVVTQPDKPNGRGQKIVFSPVKSAAAAYNIPVLQPDSVKDAAFAAQLAVYAADVFVVAAYGQILPEALLHMPKHGCLNIHGSLLPQYRGAAPIHRAIINGETTTGVTIMRMDRGLDTGDMLLKAAIGILPDDTTGTLHDKMAALGAKTLIEALDLIEKGRAVYERQDDRMSSYAGMIDKKTGHIDWCKNTVEIINLVRGLNPWPCAYTFADGRLLKIWAAEAYATDEAGTPGEVINIIDKRGFVVKTKDSGMLVTEVQAQGGKRMSAGEYLRGRRLEAGAVLK